MLLISTRLTELRVFDAILVSHELQDEEPPNIRTRWHKFLSWWRTDDAKAVWKVVKIYLLLAGFRFFLNMIIFFFRY